MRLSCLAAKTHPAEHIAKIFPHNFLPPIYGNYLLNRTQQGILLAFIANSVEMLIIS